MATGNRPSGHRMPAVSAKAVRASRAEAGDMSPAIAASQARRDYYYDRGYGYYGGGPYYYGRPYGGYYGPGYYGY